MTQTTPPDTLEIGGKTFASRLLLGTGRYPSPEILLGALAAAAPALATVSIRRVNAAAPESNFLGLLPPELPLLPNTAGCYTAKDAVLTAHLAREALGTAWVKVEVIGDEATLLPEPLGLLEACTTLVQEGFTVLPYCSDDVELCKRLEGVGCAAVMPLAAPIGTGLGIQNAHRLELIKRAVRVPVIVDAGLGSPSDACRALELGLDAVLLNTAVAGADDPIRMAEAFKWAVRAGRAAYRAGRIPALPHAQASSPLEGLIS